MHTHTHTHIHHSQQSCSIIFKFKKAEDRPSQQKVRSKETRATNIIPGTCGQAGWQAGWQTKILYEIF